MLYFWIFAVLLLGVRLFTRLRSPLAKIPGPRITAVTSIWLKVQEFIGRRRPFIHELHLQYGPVVRLGPNEVSFSSLEAMREIYMSDGSGYDRTELYETFVHFGARTTFSTPKKAEHARTRRQFADRYLMTNVLKPQPLANIRQHAHTVVTRCEEVQGKSLDVYALFHYYALDCITYFLFGSRGTHSINNPKDQELMRQLLFHDSLQRGLLGYYVPWLAPWLPTSLTTIGPIWAPKPNEYVLSMEDHFEAEDHTLIKRLHERASEIPWLNAAAECKDHLMAGLETVGDVLCWLMWMISKPQNLAMQQRLRQELIEAGPDVALDSLPYLDALLKETLRCYPPAPMSMPRYAPAGGCTIDGYSIPGGTIVSCQPYSVHRINDHVFPQPERFWPERWLEEKGAAERNRLLFSFSVGGRGCIGKNLAMVEMKVLLQELYTRFQTAIAPDMSGSMEPYDQILASRPKDQTCKLIFTMI